MECVWILSVGFGYLGFRLLLVFTFILPFVLMILLLILLFVILTIVIVPIVVFILICFVVNLHVHIHELKIKILVFKYHLILWLPKFTANPLVILHLHILQVILVDVCGLDGSKRFIQDVIVHVRCLFNVWIDTVHDSTVNVIISQHTIVDGVYFVIIPVQAFRNAVFEVTPHRGYRRTFTEVEEFTAVGCEWCLTISTDWCI